METFGCFEWAIAAVIAGVVVCVVAAITSILNDIRMCGGTGR